MKLNKKSIVEIRLILLIVILAIVMLVGVTAIGPVMENSRKKAISSEASIIIDAVQLAYIQEGDAIDGTLLDTGCYSIDDAPINEYYTKKDTNYSGYVYFDADKGKVIKYVLYNSGTGYGTISSDDFVAQVVGEEVKIAKKANLTLDAATAKSKLGC